jgi:hypothetical protein
MPSRRPLSKRERFGVLMRDGFRCVYCGAHGAGVALEVDHVQSVADGGEDHQHNLATACATCNNGKGALSLPPRSPGVAVLATLIAPGEALMVPYVVGLAAGYLNAEYALGADAERRALSVCDETHMEVGAIAAAVPSDPAERARIGLLLFELIGRDETDPVSARMLHTWRKRLGLSEGTK